MYLGKYRESCKMNSQIAIIGCGKMGLALSIYCLKLGMNYISLCDINLDQEHILGKQIEKEFPNANISYGIRSKKFDVILLALSGPNTKKFIMEYANQELFKNRKIFISIGRPNYDDPNDHNAFNQWLINNQISLLFGFGLEPGLTEIMTSYIISQFKKHNINLDCHKNALSL